jgi:cell fate regulator YaaT (PSP1 superfamily)
MNTFDWLTQMDISDVDQFGTVEVSFKNGSRKSFFHLPPHLHLHTGDMVVVESKNGYDIGRISLSGELVRLQMKKKKIKEDSVIPAVIRQANERDLERLEEARRQEKPSLIQARAISRSLGLDMKIGDVEFQGDKRKATFFYTANGRVDFRELIRHFAREFRVKIEMRQIGARQESARIGGLGSCGRELCCSTWLTDFKSVSTAAARYQNLAINQAKLSGQCGRLKCCLNYELDTYMEAVQAFPKKADKLQTESGAAVLVKTDIFKQLMFYAYTEGRNRGKLYALKIEQVAEIQALNKKGEKPIDLGLLAMAAIDEEDQEPDYEDVTGFIELPPEQRKKKSRNKRRKPSNRSNKPDDRSRREDPKKKPDERPRRDRPKKKEEGPKKEKPQVKGEEKSGDQPNQKRRRNNRRRSKNRKPDNRNNNNQQGNNPTKDN